MKKLLKNSCLFCIPIVLWVVFILIVDPFNYFNKASIIPISTKIENAKPLNNLMFNIFEEVHSPIQNLLIGDSRTNALPINYIEKVTGEKYYKLNSNALKLNEIVELFWLANDYKKIKNVYIGINFNMFNQYSYADRVTSVKAIVDNPLLYIFNRSVAEAAFLVVKSSIIKRPVVRSKPKMTKEEFWQWNLKVKADDHYGKYKFPDEVYNKMIKMVNYAKENDINRVFIIVPHHIEFQQRVKDYNLIGQQLRFKKSLFNLNVKTIDYDYVNEITKYKKNFNDPIHYNRKIAKIIVDEVWSGPLKYGKLLTKNYIDSISVNKLSKICLK